jgi:hypothetical protein
MRINDFEQQQLAYCWLREANLNGDHPVVYAGHELKKDGSFAVRFFLLKQVNGVSQYGTIRIPWEQVQRDAVRFGVGQID